MDTDNNAVKQGVGGYAGWRVSMGENDIYNTFTNQDKFF